ncbi:MAG: hypothetical protein OHK0013_22070 [Sandaracinaceae bacterium]
MKQLKSLWSLSLVVAALTGAFTPSSFGISTASAQDTTTAGGSGGTESTATPATAAEGDGESDDTPLATPTPATAQQSPEGQDSSTGDAAALAAPTGDAANDDGQAQPSHPAPSEDEAHAAEAQAAAEPLAWRNSFFNYSLAATFNTFCRDCQLSYNPNVYQFMSLTPRWYVDPSTFFFFSLGAFFEFTDDDASAYNREFQLTDMIVELRRTIPWEGFVFIPAARLTFPTSKGSQGAQRYVNTGLGLTVVRPIPEALGMTVALITRYQRWFAGSNITAARGQCLPPSTAGGFDGGDATVAGSNQTSAICDGRVANESDRIITGVSINITPAEHLTVTLSAFWAWIHLFDLGSGSVDTLTGMYTPELAGGSTRWRNFTFYSLAVAYDFTEWLNVNLSVANSTVFAPLYNEDGSVRSPFNPDTQIALGATITLDGVYAALHDDHEEEDGLTPEERQRRRQGLASRDANEDEQRASSQTGGRGSF